MLQHQGGDCGDALLAVVQAVFSEVQAFPEGDGRFPLLGRQVDVAAAHGEAVGFTHGGGGDNLDREIEVGRHPADQRLLLVVLRAEHGDVGLNEVEQFQHDRGDAAKVSRADRSFHRGRNAFDRDVGRKARGVEGILLGGEDEVDAGLTRGIEILFERPGVLRKVFVGGELRGIDEDRRHDKVGLRSADAKQADVTGV